MPTVVTDREAFRETVNDALEAARVPVEVRVTVADPFAAYRRARDGPGGVYLETTAGQSGWGYFAVDPVERLQVGSDLANEADVPTLAELRRLLDGERLVRGDCDVPYPCGAFGWLSSDVARELETLPETTVDDRGLPRLQVGVYDTVAAREEPREGRRPGAAPTRGASASSGSTAVRR